MDIKNTGIYHLFDDYRQNILKQLKLAKYFSIVITRDCDDLPASNSLLLKISKSGKHKQYNSPSHRLVGVSSGVQNNYIYTRRVSGGVQNNYELKNYTVKYII